jgi:transcriptional regulator with GAF, ATPase, and Fis domain
VWIQGREIQVNPNRLPGGLAMLKQSWWAILSDDPPPEQGKPPRLLWPNILAVKTEVCTSPLLTRNGDLIPVETHITRGRWNNQEALFSVSHDIIERLKAEREIQRRTTQLETLRQIGLELTAQLDLKTLLHSMTLHAVRLLEAQRGGFFLYRPDLDALEWVAAIGFENPMIGSTLRRGEGLSGKVWETGMPLVVDDYHQWAGRSTQYDQVAGHALIGVPVQWGGEILGVLAISTNSPRTFSTTDAELLNLLTTQAAIAIRNANLLQAERGQRALAEALVKATTAVTTPLNRTWCSTASWKR